VTIEQPAGEQELWSQAVRGDGDAFAEVYRRYADRIYGYCFRRTASWSTAQDLTSVVFLEAWRRRAAVGFDAQGSVVGWLFAVANNVVRNSDRSLRRHRAALMRLPAPADEPDFAEGTADRMDDETRMLRVLAALAELSDSDRELLALGAWSGLSQQQIADALGVPVGTVKSRLARARQRLRSRSEPEARTAIASIPTTPQGQGPR
jgi:RNA polymerase sigma factor (sigma-70 family)